MYHLCSKSIKGSPSSKGEVIPIGVEGIRNSDGNNKNDCEYNVAKRLIKRLRKDYPKLNMVICGDAL